MISCDIIIMMCHRWYVLRDNAVWLFSEGIISNPIFNLLYEAKFISVLLVIRYCIANASKKMKMKNQ